MMQAATSWKTVMVHAEAGSHASARLEAAAALAADLDALLIGVGAEAIPPIAFTDPYMAATTELVTQMHDAVAADLQSAEQVFRRHAAGARHEWRAVSAPPGPSLAAQARACDLIVSGGVPAGGVDPNRNSDPAELALTSGRPILVAPSAAHRLRARKIVVAWKDTREARRALADAMPILRVAEDVLVLAVCESKAMADAEAQTSDVVAALQRHGLKARAKVASKSDGRAADVLNGEAAEIGADLIVAGCYGRSRMTEWVFGGVTRDLLHDPQRFVLFSH
jgi:nucleotide-binding universal stress UspA family protein